MFNPIARKFHEWRLRRIAVLRLHQLDDRLLADLGATRDAIEDFVYGRNC
jgi:uncharacterized protein YjiS (DUF1127 family)